MSKNIKLRLEKKGDNIIEFEVLDQRNCEFKDTEERDFYYNEIIKAFKETNWNEYENY